MFVCVCVRKQRVCIYVFWCLPLLCSGLCRQMALGSARGLAAGGFLASCAAPCFSVWLPCGVRLWLCVCMCVRWS